MKLVIVFIRNINFYCIFKDFEEMLDYLTIVSLRSHFFKTNLISLTLLQSVDFVYRLKGQSLNSVLFCVGVFRCGRNPLVLSVGKIVEQQKASLV